jgi:hypothetical protein
VTPGAARVHAVIDAADALAAWSPEDLADVFCLLRELPDMLGSIAEAVTVVAITAEDTRVPRSEITSATEEAAGWVTAAASGLGQAYAPWSMLRGGTSRWLPRGA